jgi:hypothetical protein
MGHRIAAAVLAAFLVLALAVAVPARADVIGGGVAAMTITTPFPGLGAPATVDSISLRGTVLANGKGANVNLHVAPWTGTADHCNSSNCGYVGTFIHLPSEVVVWGVLGDGSGVAGTCRRGEVALGFFGGASLTAECDVQLRGVSTGAFRLDVATVNVGPKYHGVFCTDSPLSCAIDTNVYNPGIGS